MTMSFRFPFPVPPPEPWMHRDEDVTLARVGSHPHSKRAGSFEPTLPPSSASRQDAASEGTSAAPAAIPRKNWAFADPIAFRYLEDDPSVTLVQRRGVLRGYELYLVEQWACSRESPTLVIATYTGDENHSIVVGVLGVPADEKAWSPRLRLYSKAIQQYHARPKETDLGELMVTNLSSFPSALTVIPVPDGDIRAHRQVFIVNEDLKRLGCSGRSGMTLTDPTPATQAKFYQQYRINDRIPFFEAVLELVKLCQTSLFLFGQLEVEYVDGLLCDKTETAIGNWWTELGAEYYNVEPTDGILGPTTVAALLGMLMGARKRLHYLGAPVVKDVFDMANTKRGISWFQKTQKLDKTRRLDRQTILKLHSITAKAAAGEGWGVQKAVKSTVAEIGGKRGELVIGMVGGRDKGAIADVETLDLDKFIDLASGERVKWLWHGKPRRERLPEQSEKASDVGALLFGNGKEDNAAAASASQGNRRMQSLPLSEEVQRGKDEPPSLVNTPGPPSAATMPEGSPGDKDALRRGVFKSVAGRVSDARSGLGRIKDTIGNRRGHVSRLSRDDISEGAFSNPSISTLAQSSAAISSPTGVGRAFTWKNKPEEYLEAFRKEAEQQSRGHVLGVDNGHDAEVKPSAAAAAAAATATAAHNSSQPRSSRMGSEDWSHTVNGAITEEEGEPADAQQQVDVESAIETNLLGPLEVERSENPAACYLQRRHSIGVPSPDYLAHSLNEARWARRLSFGDAEEAVLHWEDLVIHMGGDGDDDDGEADERGDGPRPSASSSSYALARHASLAEPSRALYASLTSLRADLSPWVLSQVSSLAGLESRFSREQDRLQTLYYQLSEAHRRAEQGSSELVAAERARATEALREVEVLVARLEYEISALEGKVADVEDGVQLFERQVGDVETRAEELKKTLETETWLHWFVRTLTGIGTGPNITRTRSEGAAAGPAIDNSPTSPSPSSAAKDRAR